MKSDWLSSLMCPLSKAVGRGIPENKPATIHSNISPLWEGQLEMSDAKTMGQAGAAGLLP